MGPAEGVRSGGDEHSWTPISCRCLSRNDRQPSAAQYQRAGFAAAGEVRQFPGAAETVRSSVYGAGRARLSAVPIVIKNDLTARLKVAPSRSLTYRSSQSACQGSVGGPALLRSTQTEPQTTKLIL